MKTTATVVGASTALTLLFYVLAYFFLPPPAPSAAMVTLFAGVAIVIVLAFKFIFRKRDSGPMNHVFLFLVVSASFLTLASCHKSANGADPNALGPAPENSSEPESTSRITGNGILLSDGVEDSGYGLYSYALIAHAPSGDEALRYSAFITALLKLPSASSEAKLVDKKRINITYLLLTKLPGDWDQRRIESKVDYAIANYDYARAAVILASIPGHHGTGPLITSALSPISGKVQPHPVLVQDLSRAQPILMVDYVNNFVSQVSQETFWQPNTLANFSLSLRNVLETSANGLGMSKDAVASWVHYSK
jgi:hypothetical protein